jgi:DNA-binding IclR family transcriptional regulator
MRIDLHLSQSELAAMIGTSRSTLNRCLLSLERRGVIARPGQRFVLRRPEALG